MLSTIKKEMAISFLRHYVKIYMLKNKISNETEALTKINKNLPILAFSNDETEKIGAKFITKNKWLFTEEILYPSNGTEITDFDILFNVPPSTIKGHAAVETCAFINIFHEGDKLSTIVRENEAGLDDNVFRLFPKKITWDCITDKKFTSDFMEENIEKMDWSNICRNQKLEVAFMHKYADKLKWNSISCYQKNLPEDFMDYFKEKLDWSYLCQNQIMSETFMEEHRGYINWNIASRYQEMSLDFIEHLKDYVNWDKIAGYKTLPTPFIEKYYSALDMNIILCHQKVKESFIRNHYHEWNKKTRSIVFSHQGVSKKFCDEHKNDIKSRSNDSAVSATWSDLFSNKDLIHFDFKGTVVHKNVKADQLTNLIIHHKGPIMVKPSNSKYYFRTVYIRNKDLYRVVITRSGYKNWKKCYTPLHSELFTIDEVVAAINKTIVLPAPEKTEE